MLVGLGKPHSKDSQGLALPQNDACLERRHAIKGVCVEIMSGRPKSELSRLRGAAHPILSFAYLLLIFGLPLTLCVAMWQKSGTKWQPLALLACPFGYAGLFALVAGILSIPHHKGIIAGKFPRDVRHRVYFHRRLYGLCWTSLFYFKPVYFLILAIDPLRRGCFRLFGYRGNLDFTIYPDTWIRDLPLLAFGKGAYIANRSTLGSNICLQSGEILVGGISIGERSVVGHLGVVGLGTTMQADSELGVGVATGIQVKIGRNTRIGAISGLNHGSSVGNDCGIGAMSYVGSGTRVLDHVQLPAASQSADHLVIESRKTCPAENEMGAAVPRLANIDPHPADEGITERVRDSINAVRAAQKENMMRRILVMTVVLGLTGLCSEDCLAQNRAANNSSLAPVQQPIKPFPSNPCANKPHGTRGYNIPQNGSEITRVTHPRGVINCLSTEPASGSCHIEVASSGLKMDLHANDNMSLGDRDDTFTFTCGLGATRCSITHCD